MERCCFNMLFTYLVRFSHIFYRVHFALFAFHLNNHSTAVGRNHFSVNTKDLLHTIRPYIILIYKNFHIRNLLY